MKKIINTSMDTSMDTSYNGWTNYATWRVNLEYIDYMELTDHQAELDAYPLSLELKDYIEMLIDEGASKYAIANRYAHAFIENVNWLEIALHLKSTND